jgi:hypothetical protein
LRCNFKLIVLSEEVRRSVQLIKRAKRSEHLYSSICTFPSQSLTACLLSIIEHQIHYKPSRGIICCISETYRGADFQCSFASRDFNTRTPEQRTAWNGETLHKIQQLYHVHRYKRTNNILHNNLKDYKRVKRNSKILGTHHELFGTKSRKLHQISRNGTMTSENHKYFLAC